MTDSGGELTIECIRTFIPYTSFWMLSKAEANDVAGCRTYGLKLLARGFILQLAFFALGFITYLWFPRGAGDYHFGATIGVLPWILAPMLDYWEGVECLLLAGDGLSINGERSTSHQMVPAVVFLMTLTLSLFAVGMGIFSGAEDMRKNSERRNERRVLIAQLDKGRDHWNGVVNVFPACQIEFDGVDLSGRDLSGYNFHYVRFRGTKLRKANLDDASLDGADLTGADLTDASLRRSIFGAARLDNADLSGANLTGAHVRPNILATARSTGATVTNLQAGSDYVKILEQRFPKTNAPR